MRKALSVMLVLSMLTVTVAGCANKAQEGAGAGAMGGALIGALASKNKLLGAGIGAGIGLALGYIIGNEWDKNDERQLNHTLETAPSGQTSSWRNPDTGKTYYAVPQAGYQQDGKTYRDVTIRTDDGEPVKATAYRQPDGSWRLVQ